MFNIPGFVSQLPPSPEEYYFVRGGQILLTSKEYSLFEVKRGNLIDTTKWVYFHFIPDLSWCNQVT